jgi:hypothetical protein
MRKHNEMKQVDESLILVAALEGLELQKRRIEAQIAEVRALLGRAASDAPPTQERPGRNLSPEARKRIGAAQKRRWKQYRKERDAKNEEARPAE